MLDGGSKWFAAKQVTFCHTLNRGSSFHAVILPHMGTRAQVEYNSATVEGMATVLRVGDTEALFTCEVS